MKASVESVNIPAVVFFDTGGGVEFAFVDDEDAESAVIGVVATFPVYVGHLLRVITRGATEYDGYFV